MLLLSRLCYEHDVCPSVRPSVRNVGALVDCDHVVQQQVHATYMYPV